MIDALLHAVRDHLRKADFGYDSPALCEITDSDGRPPPRSGHVFVAVHEGATRSTSARNLDEYFDFSLTLTMRVSVPLDRVGDALLASKLARKSGAGNPSFNARLEQLRKFGHMNWKATVLKTQTPASANDNIVTMHPTGSGDVYGFVEPARYAGAERPALVTGEWFSSDPAAPDVGLKAELKFTGARRLQPHNASQGTFV